MKTLYFDCFSGISGDMVLGAFLDLGIEETYLKSELAKLNLDHYELYAEKTSKKGVSGTHCHVQVEEEHVHRHFGDIRRMIEASDLDESVKHTAIAIFRRVAEAEAAVHGVEVDHVHFHEVGALDSILDIVGAAICFHKLAPEKVLVSGINTGSGWVKCAHGRIPVPAPATVEIMSKSHIPMYSKYIGEEAATPTGVAIAAELAEYEPEMPQMKVEKVAYGFGTKEFPVLNGLRLVYGETEDKKTDAVALQSHCKLSGQPAFNSATEVENAKKSNRENMVLILETNIDDMTGESAGYVMERIFEAGAKDAFYTSIYMKKNRPAMMLTVICALEDEGKMSDIIFRETSTIGIRKRLEERICMARRIRVLDTAYGSVRVKVCEYGEIHKETFEYEDVAKIAKSTKRSHLDIIRELTSYLTGEQG